MGCRVKSEGCRGVRCRVWGVGCRVQGAGCRVQRETEREGGGRGESSPRRPVQRRLPRVAVPGVGILQVNRP